MLIKNYETYFSFSGFYLNFLKSDFKASFLPLSSVYLLATFLAGFGWHDCGMVLKEVFKLWHSLLNGHHIGFIRGENLFWPVVDESPESVLAISSTAEPVGNILDLHQ